MLVFCTNFHNSNLLLRLFSSPKKALIGVIEDTVTVFTTTAVFSTGMCKTGLKYFGVFFDK